MKLYIPLPVQPLRRKRKKFILSWVRTIAGFAKQKTKIHGQSIKRKPQKRDKRI